MTVIVYKGKKGYQVMGPFLNDACARKFAGNLPSPWWILTMEQPKEIKKHLKKTLRKELSPSGERRIAQSTSGLSISGFFTPSSSPL